MSLGYDDFLGETHNFFIGPSRKTAAPRARPTHQARRMRSYGLRSADLDDHRAAAPATVAWLIPRAGAGRGSDPCRECLRKCSQSTRQASGARTGGLIWLKLPS